MDSLLLPPAESDATADTIFGGRVVVAQSRSGYRFNIDSLLLAHRAAALRPARVLDAGADSGVIALALWALLPDARITAVELQPGPAALLDWNIRRNGASARLTALRSDLRDLVPPGSGLRYDVVVMNPPYHRPGTGQTNPDPARARARHQLHGEIEALVAACAAQLTPRGALAFSYPVRTLPDLLNALRAEGFVNISSQPVQPAPNREAPVALVTARRRSSPRFRIEPPLCISDGERRLSPAIGSMLDGVPLPADRP